MRNLFVFILLSIPFLMYGQITLTAEDMPQVGDVFSSVNCEIPVGFDVGSPGANQTYDFSMLTPLDTFTNNIVSPNGTAGASEFPNATLASEFEGDFVYFQQTSSEFLLLGLYTDTSASGIGQYMPTHFNPTSKVIEIPSTYNTNFTDMSGYVNTFADDSGLGDSIRYTISIVDDILFDGYGTVITPDGSFDGLRERRISTLNSVFEIYSMGQWTEIISTTNTDTSYNWFGNNNLDLASVNIYGGEIIDISYSISGVQVSAPVASFNSNDLGGGTINFNDNSTNSPTSWLWDFGDGSTSIQQDPQYTYSSGGAYNVCLTATNTAGEDTYCETIDVIVSATDDISSSINVKVFPNPVRQVINVQLENTNLESLDFQLVNSLGQSVLKWQVETIGSYSLDVKNLTTGMYYYTFKDTNGEIRKRGSLIKR